MNKKFRKLILPASILVASQTFALGLGSLQVDSLLDEELKGKITLVLDGTEDLENLKVSLASEADYQRVDLDKSYVPSNIKVSVAEENEQKYIKISSRGPVSEPIVSLLVVVDWANGHLLREYTLLLDPPLFNTTQVEQNYSDPVQTQTYEAPKQIENTKPKQPEAVVNNTSNYSSSSQVVVEAGDTLWKIASRYNDGYSSPQQMMVAIFNNNPQAFQNDDMNFLRKGSVLNIPNSNDVSLISKGDAIAEVKSQTQNWSRLNSQNDSGTSNSSSSVDYGIELVPPSDSESSDYTNSSGSSAKNIKALADLSRAREELASSTLENEELSSRVLELENIVKDQELALSLKDDDLALLQNQLKESDSESSSDEMSDDVWDATTSSDTMTEDTMTTDTTSDDTMTDEDTMSGDTMVADTMSEDTMSDDTMSEDTMSDDEFGSLKISDVNQSDNENEDQQTTQTVITPPKREKSLMDKVLDFKMEILGGLGALLLAIIGFVFIKRRNMSEDEPESGSFYEESSEEDADLTDDLAELDASAEDLDLTNLEDELEADLDAEADISQEEEISEGELSEEEPDVVVMDDSLEDDLEDDLGLEDLDDDFSIDEINLDEDEDETELVDLEFDSSSLSDDQDDQQQLPQDEIEEKDDLDEMSLDFDLDDLDLEDDADEEDTDKEDTTEQRLGDEFDLDIDLTSEDQDLDEVIEEGEELADLVFDTGERSIVNDSDDEISDDRHESEDEIEDLEFDLSEDMFNTDDLELGVDDGTDESKDEADVTDVSLDVLDVADIPSGDEEEVDIGLDFDDIVDDDAIDTKLDLAKAYFEMGDIDGAKQMVTEIINEGTEEQKSKAEELKDEIEKS